MQEQGYISSSQASVDIGAVRLKKQNGQNSVRYFTDWVLPQLDFLLPETFEPIEVWTTIDVDLQETAGAAIKANVPGGTQGALVSLDRDGAVLAMVGRSEEHTSELQSLMRNSYAVFCLKKKHQHRL